MGAEYARILVIPVMREAGAAPAALREWIAQVGRSPRVRVEHSLSLADAAAKLTARRFDAVLWDLGSEAGSGLDLLRDLRARGDTTPFVLLVAGESSSAVTPRVRLLGRARCLAREQLSVGRISEALGTAVAREGPPRPSSGDLVPAMIWKTDAEGRFARFSRRWCRFTGRSEEKERGSGWLDGLHPADVDPWIQLYSSALASRQEFKIDVRLRSAGGDFRWVRLHGLPGLDARGRFTGYLGSAFEVTDLKQAYLDLAAELEQVSQAGRELESFLYAACHDLNEPLRTLQNDLQSPEGPRVGQALEGVRRMQQLLRDLLECAQISRRGDPLEPTDMAVPLEWALANLGRPMEEAQAQVTRDPLPVVRADAIQMAQLLQNLIGNAIKFRGEAPPLIHLGVAQTAEEWRFRVQDNGVGIDPLLHEVIFEPFRRGSGGSTRGRGMGLTICKKIIERHGGRIWVESAPGKGSVFFFSLPR